MNPIHVVDMHMSKEKRMIEGQLSLFDFTIISESKNSENKKNINNKRFSECAVCWCFDCRHNAENEGIPRDICGTMKSCPACRICIDSGKADVCTIGSAKEGCKIRAIEEGIIEEGTIV